MQVDLRIRSWHRLDGSLDDDALGERLRDVVQRALDGGRSGAAAVVVRRDRIDVIDLREVARAEVPPRRFLAAMTRVEPDDAGPAEAVGLIGRFAVRRGEGPGVPVALAFLEWSDGRWWRWQALLDPGSGQLRDGAELISRAVDGAPRPSGLGGWWTIGRRERLGGRLSRREPVVVH